MLVHFPLEQEYLDAIASVDPRVQVLKTYEGAGDNAQPLSEVQIEALLAQAEVFFGFGFPIEWADKAPHLRWVQLASAGADRVLGEGLLQRHPDLVLTTASGIHEVPISEHILAMILYFGRGFDQAVHNQARRKWARYTAGEARGKTVCLVGYGPIARRAAALCHALGMKVVTVRASIAEEQPGLDAVERFYPIADLNRALAESDYVVIAAPRTPQSEGMIGKAQFEAMKSSAVLINISRGALVDEAAMIEALRDKRIAGAGLDVFAEEPLPESSLLWDMPNVLITPHVSGSNPYYARRATDLFCDNLSRYLRNEPLGNLVVGERGY